MPNWCTQKIVVKGENLDELRELLEPDFDQWYGRAVFISKRFALLGMLGILKPIYRVKLENFPELVQGVGKKTKANTAFTYWLGYIANRSPLTRQVADNIERLAEQASLDKVMGKVKLTDATLKKYRDLIGNEDLQEPFKPYEFDRDDVADEGKRIPLSLTYLVPLLLGEELNAYWAASDNGDLPDFWTRYYANCHRLGTKWSTLWCESRTELKQQQIVLHTRSAWSPILPALQEISLKFCCDVDVKFAELGMAYYGHKRWLNGLLVESEEGDLKLKEYTEEEEDEDDFRLELTEDMPKWLDELNDLGG